MHNSTISVPHTCFSNYVTVIREYSTPSCLKHFKIYTDTVVMYICIIVISAEMTGHFSPVIPSFADSGLSCRLHVEAPRGESGNF